MTFRSMGWIGSGVLVAALAAVQFIRPEMKHPPHEPLLEGAVVPGGVIRVVERACRDCHSDKVDWPWYTRIMPVSLLVARDVNRGRAFLNFSKWATYSTGRKLGYLASMKQATRSGIMPPRAYRVMHASARLSPGDRSMLEEWARNESRRLRE